MRIIKNENKSKESQNVNQIIPLGLDGSYNPLPLSAMQRNLNVSDLFIREQELSNIYRIQADINVVASNVLINYDGIDSAESIFDIMDYNADTEDYLFQFDEVVKEKDGWFYRLTNCNPDYLKPYPTDFSLMSGDVAQWECHVTYEAKKNHLPIVIGGVNVSDGIQIYSGTPVEVGGTPMTSLICHFSHNLKAGDTVNVYSNTTSDITGAYTVESVGLSGDFDDSIFTINTTGSTDYLTNQHYFKKEINGVESDYYGLWNKRLNQFQPKTYKTAFAKSIYNQQINSITYNEEVNTDELIDENNVPIDKLYLTFIKKQSEREPLWTKLISGVDSPLFTNPFDISIINNTTSSVEAIVNTNSDYYFNGVYEYNPYISVKTKISDGLYRFNTINREDNNLKEGYYYKPHYAFQIRTLSEYVNQSFSGETFVPSYATILENGYALWRDIYSKNYEQNIPFINGSHYLYNKFNLFIRRQDPCEETDLVLRNYIKGICVEDVDFQQATISEICK